MTCSDCIWWKPRASEAWGNCIEPKNAFDGDYEQKCSGPLDRTPLTSHDFSCPLFREKRS